MNEHTSAPELAIQQPISDPAEIASIVPIGVDTGTGESHPNPKPKHTGTARNLLIGAVAAVALGSAVAANSTQPNPTILLDLNAITEHLGGEYNSTGQFTFGIRYGFDLWRSTLTKELPMNEWNLILAQFDEDTLKLLDSAGAKATISETGEIREIILPANTSQTRTSVGLEHQKLDDSLTVQVLAKRGTVSFQFATASRRSHGSIDGLNDLSIAAIAAEVNPYVIIITPTHIGFLDEKTNEIKYFDYNPFETYVTTERIEKNNDWRPMTDRIRQSRRPH
jgi:hypothetical protein